MPSGPDPAFSWLATVNTLGLAVTSLVIGRLSDIFGRRWFIIVGNASGFIGAVMGAFAPNIKVLIVANTFLGIAAGPQLCFVFVGMELFPNKYRGKRISCLIPQSPSDGLGSPRLRQRAIFLRLSSLCSLWNSHRQILCNKHSWWLEVRTALYCRYFDCRYFDTRVTNRYLDLAIT